MRLYDTLTGRILDFESPNGRVGMYVCGITPYSSSHIGHAMSAVAFDVVRRYLEYRGFEVRHVQNFTDIDDKMIDAARKRNIEVSELAGVNIREYIGAMSALNVVPAHEYPRATQEIDKIVEIIGGLIDRGYAYAVEGDVYFRVRRFDDYGKLSHRSVDDLQAGARVEIDERKEDVLDFALWKSQKPGEPRGTAPGGKADRAGTSSAARCRSSTWERLSTYTAAVKTSCSRTTKTSWLSPSRSLTGVRSRDTGFTTGCFVSAPRR